MNLYAIGFEFIDHSCCIRLCKLVRTGEVLIWEHLFNTNKTWEKTLEDDVIYGLMFDQLKNGWYSSSREPGVGHVEAATKIATLVNVPFIGEIKEGVKPYQDGDI